MKPSSPSEELAARRSWTGPTLADGVLTAELAGFCQSGLSIVLASCDRRGRPVVGRGLACRIGDRARTRIVLRQPSNAAVLQALANGSGIAVTFTQPSTHRSIQLKAAGVRVAPPDVSDGPAVAVQTASFRADLVARGYPETFAVAFTAFEPHELAAVDFFPEHAFVQTPGPSAGSALRP